jgi:hypothetical protein
MTKRLTAGCGVAVLAVALVLLLIPRNDAPPALAAAEEEALPEFQGMQAQVATVQADEVELAGALTELEEEDEPIHYNEAGMNPEDQPRTFLVQHYRPGEVPAGYRMHNVRLTDRGFELEPPAAGQEGQPRIGMIESPPIPFDFPANSVAPSWIDDLPPGTSVLVEIAVSPDGENWGMWHAADVDHDSFGQINQFYPDGSPNLNFGYTPGGLFIWGPLQWNYVKYTVALYSETAESPAFSSRRLYVQDSTMGEGRPAVLNVAESTEGGF